MYFVTPVHVVQSTCSSYITQYQPTIMYMVLLSQASTFHLHRDTAGNGITFMQTPIVCLSVDSFNLSCHKIKRKQINQGCMIWQMNTVHEQDYATPTELLNGMNYKKEKNHQHYPSHPFDTPLMIYTSITTMTTPMFPTRCHVNSLWQIDSWYDVIKWKHFPRYWTFARGIHRLPVNSPHKGQWRGALIYSLICASING